ncbi:hypothetical protein AMTR_s00178p00046550 [Amborella trichopoda]|uniref:Uncharacterized protein n=1 Tax=Amborella trichopoda TaxID=13333 RepID=W1PQE6_AMBTC|nr:hypothetical protein AMTR_s00178p00046550 [Amborella trichopoda]
MQANGASRGSIARKCKQHPDETLYGFNTVNSKHRADPSLQSEDHAAPKLYTCNFVSSACSKPSFSQPRPGPYKTLARP